MRIMQNGGTFIFFHCMCPPKFFEHFSYNFCCNVFDKPFSVKSFVKILYWILINLLSSLFHHFENGQNRTLVINQCPFKLMFFFRCAPCRSITNTMSLCLFVFCSYSGTILIIFFNSCRRFVFMWWSFIKSTRSTT